MQSSLYILYVMGLFCMIQPTHILLTNYIIAPFLQNAIVFVDFVEKMTDNTVVNHEN